MSASSVNDRTSGIRGFEQPVKVDRRIDGSVVVGIRYPHKARVDLYVGLAITAVIAVAVPLLVGFLAESWVGAIAGFVIATPVCLLLLEIYRIAGATQEWVASEHGLTITRVERSGAMRQRFIARTNIRDVRIKFFRGGCDIRVLGRYLALRAPTPHLRGLGGDQIARTADALREGLGLEPVEWPSGRPRKVSPAGSAGSERPASADSEWVKALLFGVMFVIAGSFFAVYGSHNAWQTFDRLHSLHQTTCVLLDKRVIEGTGEHQWGRHSSGSYQAWTRVRYEDGAVSRTVAGDLFPTNTTENGRPPKEVLWSMRVGKSYPLWIDGRDRNRVYLSRGDETPWSYGVMVGGGTLFALCGSACLVAGIITRLRQAARQSHITSS